MPTPNNCKSCAHRSDRQHANGMTDCHRWKGFFPSLRVSLGDVCSGYTRAKKPKPLVKAYGIRGTISLFSAGLRHGTRGHAA